MWHLGEAVRRKRVGSNKLDVFLLNQIAKRFHMRKLSTIAGIIRWILFTMFHIEESASLFPTARQLWHFDPRMPPSHRNGLQSLKRLSEHVRHQCIVLAVVDALNSLAGTISDTKRCFGAISEAV